MKTSILKLFKAVIYVVAAILYGQFLLIFSSLVVAVTGSMVVMAYLVNFCSRYSPSFIRKVLT
jgi:hypothetical protein